MEKSNGRAEAFCRKYLQCMDPEQAAVLAGCADGYAMLEAKMVRRRLERMRKAAAGQVRREDAVRRLAQLAFGRVNDAARLALHSAEADLETLDLSAVAELKVTDKGGVEVKLIDRIRALEALCGLLSEEKAEGAGELYRVLAEATGEEGAWDDG
ncbi:terminase small subunit [Oscillibacter sp.]|mgnify:FL=1|uniref:terminase small subunit n=1 Tax=Oscillospiraceae TaxID=216572 RepID=UPI002627EB77|nr:terminase small subunit [Oscillibacter sp.]MBS6354137.1 terminase small subunit [Oscillibacter sp.]